MSQMRSGNKLNRNMRKERMGHQEDEHVVASGVGGREPLRRKERMGHQEDDFGVEPYRRQRMERMGHQEDDFGVEPYRRQRMERMHHQEDEHVVASGVGGREPFVGTVHRRRKGRENFGQSVSGMTDTIQRLRSTISAGSSAGATGSNSPPDIGVASRSRQVSRLTGAAQVFGQSEQPVRMGGHVPGGVGDSVLARPNAQASRNIASSQGRYFNPGRLISSAEDAGRELRASLSANLISSKSTNRLRPGSEPFRRREGFTLPPDEVRVQEPFKSRAKRGNTKAGPQRGVERMMQRPAPKKNMMREQYMRAGNKRR